MSETLERIERKVDSNHVELIKLNKDNHSEVIGISAEILDKLD
jgi:hypothetical protein